MALGNDGIKPDRLELRVRFVFGALLGCALGLGATRGTSSSKVAMLAMVCGGLIAGLLARQFGDRFWASHWWRGWRR
jgi:hypothetical protein